MRFRLWGVVFVVFLATRGAFAADTLKSSMGFSAAKPKGWLVLTREEVRANPDLFDAAFGKIDGADPEFLEQVQAEIKSGRVEFLFAPASNEKFRDNVNYRKQLVPNPKGPEELRQVCQALPDQLKQMFGRPIRLYACRFETVPAGKSMYLEFDGAVPGTRSLQYTIQRSPAVTLQVTGTLVEAGLMASRPVFEAFVRSIEFP